jgi:hypothetical protein
MARACTYQFAIIPAVLLYFLQLLLFITCLVLTSKDRVSLA